MALQNAVTLLRGVKDTADVIAQEKPQVISNKIWMHDPNRNLGLTWAMSEAPAESVANHIFGHNEDVPFPNWVVYQGAVESVQAATGIVFAAGAGKKLQIGSRVLFPDINEIIRLTADMASDTASAAVARNFGRGVAATSLLKPGMKGIILTPAMIQGFTTPHGLSNAMVHKSFSLTLLNYPVEVTDQEYDETHRGGNPFMRALQKSTKQCKDQQEAEMYFGGKKTDDSTYAHPISTSEGMDNYVSTNVWSASSLSRQDLMDIFMEMSFRNPEGFSCHCSGMFISMVSNWGWEFVQLTQDEQTLGLNISKIRTPTGKIVEMVPIDLFNEDETLMGKAFLVPKGRIGYRYLQNEDVRYRPIQQDEIHSRFGEILGYAGWEFYEEEMWGKITGLRFSA